MLIVAKNPDSQKNTSTAKKALKTSVKTDDYAIFLTLLGSRFNCGIIPLIKNS